MNLIIGNKYKFTKDLYDVSAFDDIKVGDVGILLDVDYTCLDDGLSCYVRFVEKGVSDWFCKDELEEILANE